MHCEGWDCAGATFLPHDWPDSNSLKLAHWTDSVTLHIPDDSIVGIVMNELK